MDNEDGELEADEDEILVARQQAIEWFDLKGKIVGEQGEYELDTPFNPEYLEQTQDHLDSICSFSKPVYNLDTEELIGYVRVSESLTDLNNTLRRLDYGLGSGIVIALLAGGMSSIWLTNRAMQPIESSFERLRQFTADASHELRSPLMAIKTNADVALKYPEGMRDIDGEKFMAIASASNQMTSLTENLLLLARTDKAIQIQTEIESDLYLSGDHILLKQLFTNLFQNALQYTPAGGSAIIKARKIDSHLKIKIEDTGIGIAPEHIDQIFERFWRADKSRSYQSGRSGLGLAIVKEIVRLHNGTILVESELSKGSCFILSFSSQAICLKY